MDRCGFPEILSLRMQTVKHLTWPDGPQSAYAGAGMQGTNRFAMGLTPGMAFNRLWKLAPCLPRRQNLNQRRLRVRMSPGHAAFFRDVILEFLAELLDHRLYGHCARIAEYADGYAFHIRTHFKNSLQV